MKCGNVELVLDCHVHAGLGVTGYIRSEGQSSLVNAMHVFL